jgi:DNA repair protein RadA/Sms
VAEGTRSFLVEVQALTVPAKSGFSRIYSDRIDSARVTRVAAVLERHAGLRFSDQDLYVNVGGGMKVGEVAIELALALALYSALTQTSLPKDLVSFGELSLSGEIRPVGFIQRREKTAKELGFTRSLVSKASKQSSLTQYGARTIREALNAIQEMH